MLIRQSQVKLPLFDVQIPVTSHFGFHNIAPWLVVFLHGNLLLELALLGMGKKLQSFKELVNPRSLHYIEFITFRSVLFLILIILPVSILLLILGRFLVLHNVIITWIQRFAIVADLILLWLLWPGVGWDYDQIQGQGIKRWKRLPKRWFLLGVTVCSVSLMILMTIPGDQKPEKHWLLSILPENHPLKSLANSWFQWRNLDLHEKVLVTPLEQRLIDNLRIQKIEDEDLQKIPTNYFQGVNMTYANLVQAVLPRIDFRAAGHGKYPTQLQGVDLSYAKMPGALLDQANLRGVNLRGAWLPRAELQKARLQGAILEDATLQNALLQDASLEKDESQNTNLQKANLQGANLSDAHLQGANLSETNLQGAILRWADLRDTDLTKANLQGADLTGAKLEKAKLDQAKLEGTILSETDIDSNQLGQAEPVSADYKKDRIAYLMTLACTNNYIAEGLVNQVIQSDRDHDRASLAEEMKKVASVPQEPDECLKKYPACSGICNLPKGLKESLNKRVTSSTK
jgi:uncharacterized protein YjbI with pentapeptide repeats